MTASRLILLLLLILVAVVIVVVVLRRGAAQRDAHRVEAAHLRSEAETIAASVAGQSAFADQAAERAEVARAEAEERAREAARLEAEAAEHRAALEATQRDYEATMRRADDIDPDVKESQYPAVSESQVRADDAGHAASDWADDDEAHGDHAEGDVPMTRAERREAREAGAADAPGADAGWAPAAASSAPAAGAAGAAAAGAAAWAERGDDDRDARGDDERDGRGDEGADADGGAESERIASAADFRDDVPAETTEVYAAQDRGSEPGMSDNSSTETTEHGEPAEMTIIGEPEAYATTEPVMASEQSPPVSPEEVGTGDRGGEAPTEGASDATREAAAIDEQRTDEQRTDERRDDLSTDEGSTDGAPAEVGAAVADTDGTDRSAADVAEQSPQERYDPTPTRDWAADEGDLLEENSGRADRLEAERVDLAHEAGDATATDTTSTTASDATDGTASDAGTSAPDAGASASAGRRISAFEEIRDGGFGVGSAAPLEGGAQPLDHPVQGFSDMTFRAPGDPGYDGAEPDVWFYDEGAAERSGFRRADG